MTLEEWGALLRVRRSERRINQYDFARSIGIHYQMLSRLENGNAVPCLQLTAEIFNILQDEDLLQEFDPPVDTKAHADKQKEDKHQDAIRTAVNIEQVEIINALLLRFGSQETVSLLEVLELIQNRGTQK